MISLRGKPTCRYEGLAARAGNALLRSMLVVTLVASLGRAGFAQSIWEVSAYRIQAWVSVDPSAALPSAWTDELAASLSVAAESRVGAVWNLTASRTPAAVRGALRRGDTPDWEQVVTVAPELKEFDKLMLVNIDRDLDGYRVSVREFDLTTRILSAPVTRTRLSVLRQVKPAALELMCDAFSPIVRIERIEDESIAAVTRAGSLGRPEASPRFWKTPSVVGADAVLQPVIRKSDRSGKVGAAGVKPVEWTVLVVDEAAGGKVSCGFRSGYRQPFRTRRSSRIQQLAYVVKPRYESTTLRVVDRRKPENVLAGYEVLSKPDPEGPSISIGRTDWRGEIVIPKQADEPVQTLFVRSGQQLLGKLPVVAGDQPELTAPLRNDDLRLEAEGFLIGVQDSLVDLVARREVLASRIRRAIDEDELEKAETLLKELRGLDTQEDFARRVQQRKRNLSAADASVQQRIDDLFSQTRALLGQYLDPKQVELLAQSIRDAKSN